MSLQNDPHFASFAEIPRLPSTAPLRTVFERLSSMGKGGFLLVAGRKTSSYVVARILAEAVMEAAGGSVDELARLAVLPVGDVIHTIAPMAIVQVSDEPLDAGAGMETFRGLQDQEDTVFQVEQGNVPVGYFLNHEGVRETLTERVWFMCKHPTAPHRNPDMNHGRCRRCPYELERTETDRGGAGRGTMRAH